MVIRETLADGAVRLSSGGCTFLYQRLRPGRLILRIRGKDRGQFGSVTREEIDAELAKHPHLELFIDASEAGSVAQEVADAWIGWLQEHRHSISCTTLLAGAAPEVAVAFGRLNGKLQGKANVIWNRSDFEKTAGTVI